MSKSVATQARTPVAPARPAPSKQRQPASKIERRSEQRDLAGLVAWLRSDRPSELPFRPMLEKQVRGDLSAIETYRGERARRVADAVDARAFAVGNVIGFVDEQPSIGIVAHEVAHVVQMLGPTPRRWTPSHPIGTVPWANPYEHAARESAFTDLAEHARGERAPIALYRAKKDDKDKVELDDHERALVTFAASDAFKPRPLSQALFSGRSGDQYTPEFTVTSPAAWRMKDLVKADAYVAGVEPNAQAISDLAAAKRTLEVAGQKVAVAKVSYKERKQVEWYTFIAQWDAALPAEVWAIPGRLGQDKESTLATLAAYAAIIKVLRAEAKIPDPNALTPVEEKQAKAIENVEISENVNQLEAEERLVRHALVDAIADSYRDKNATFDTFHKDIVLSKAFRQPGAGGKESPFEKVKGEMGEAFVTRQLGLKFEEVILPDGSTPSVVQPIFGDQSKPKGEITKSTKLSRLRRGDGILLGGVVEEGEDEKQRPRTVAEVKSYKKGPTGDNKTQMDDYARIINIPIQAFFLKRPSPEKAAEFVPFTFAKIMYFVSGKEVHDKWVLALDERLGSKYSLYEDVRLATATVDVQLKEYKEALDTLTKKRKPKLSGLDVVKTALDAANASDRRALPDADRQADLDAVRDAVVKSIIDSCTTVDVLFSHVLEKDKVFSGPLALVNGLVLKKWFETHNTNRSINDPKLQSPLPGQRRGVRPLFVGTIDASDPLESKWANDVFAGSADLLIYEQRIIIDLTQRTTDPDEEDKKIAKDLVILTRDLDIYMVTVGGAGERLFKRTLSFAEYQFANDVSKELQGKWNTMLTGDPGLKTLIKKDKVHISPDPKGPEEFVLRFSLNPIFEAKVSDASTLEPTLAVTTDHTGIKVSEAKVRLAAVRTAQIESGSITFSVAGVPGDMLSSDKPQTKSITPAPETAAKPKGKKDKPIHGQVQNKLSNLKSKLSSLLKRIETDAKLTDKGLEALVRVTAGPSGIPKVNLDEAVVKIVIGGKPTSPKIENINGKVGISVAGGKLRGSFEIDWKKNALVITGAARVENMIDGLAPVEAKVIYVGETADAPASIKIKIEKAEFKKKMKGVSLTGTARDLEYDANDGTFSGTGTLIASLGSFGTAQLENVKIEKNVLAEATISYLSRPLKYPGKGPPAITGTVDGKIVYRAGKIVEGEVHGTVQLAVKALKKLTGDKPIDLDAKVRVDEHGALSGGIKLLTPVNVGKYFRISELEAAIDERGKIETGFAIEIVNIPIFKGRSDALIKCRISEEKGFEVVKLNASWAFGVEKKDRFWGVFKIDYKEAEFDIYAKLGLKLKEGMFAEGWARYNTKTKKITTELTLPHLWLINTPEKPHKLFELKKDISIIQIPLIVGLYLHLGIDLTFKTKFQIGAQPTIKLDDFDFNDFTFRGATASVTLDGDGLSAILEVAPEIGIGAFLIHTMILRGGGGISVPIQGKAQLKPKKGTAIKFRYLPAQGNEDSKVSAGAKLGLSLTFKIDAAIQPWAEFQVLNGLFSVPKSPPWRGKPLKEFPLLPERELFTYEVNFGDDIKEEKDPKVPTESKEPPKSRANEVEKGEQVAGGEQVKQDKPKEVVEEGKKDEATDSEEGFNMKKVIEGIKQDPTFGPVWAVIEAIAEAVKFLLDLLKPVFDFIMKMIKFWFGAAIELISAFFRSLKASGFRLFGEVMKVLKELLPKEVFHILEPILEMFAKKEEDLYEVIGKGLPTTILDTIEWGVDILGIVFSLAWDAPLAIAESIYRLIKAALTLVGRLVSAFRDFVQLWVDEGELGARENEYYVGSETLGLAKYFWVADEWKIGIGRSTPYHYTPDESWPIYELGSAPAVPIWGALGVMGIQKNKSHKNYWDEATDH